MNPSIEVQITAKLDKLDAGLKVAEAKISQSAVTMGKTGEQGGSMFVDKLVGNMVKGLAMGGITTVLGGGIMTALKGINTNKSGEEIGIGIAQGIVDGAKSLPVVGVVFGIFDELINGATHYIEKLNEAVAKGVEKYISSMDAMNKATKDFQKTSREKVEDVSVAGSPEKIARLAVARQNEKAAADAQADKEIGQQALRDLRQQQDDKAKAEMAKMVDEGISGDQNRANEGRISRDEEIVKNKEKAEGDMKRAAEAVAMNDRKIDDALIAYKLANQEELNKKIKEMNKKAQDDKSAATSSLQGKNIKTAIDTSDYQGAQKQIDFKVAEDVKALKEKSLKTAMNTDDYAAALKEINSKASAEQKALEEKSLKTAMNTGDYAAALKEINNKAAAEQKALEDKSLKTAMGTGDYQTAIKEINNKAAAEQKALDEKSKNDAKEMGNQMVADWKVQQKEKYDAAVQAQQDIIDAEKQAQAQIDKIGRVDKLAGEAARGMINSGQTALGQFNFAQAGAGGTALDMAKKQVISLEKIEAATAEQVRLTKENKGFQ